MLMHKALPPLRLWPGILLLTLLGSGILYTWETLVARPAMIFGGVPELQQRSLTQWKRVLRSDAYIVGYSEWLANPLWVSYQVLPAPESMPNLPRPGRFDADWRSLRCLTVVACIDHDTYTNSGYDRGHLAPNHVIATRYGAEAQRQTFRMTNISPQNPELNRRAWQRLESLIANELAAQYAPFQVINGPLFGPRPERIGGFAGVAVPEAFYKILVRETGGANQGPSVLAFIFPQDTPGNVNLLDLLVTVQDIEQRSGLRFFPTLEERDPQTAAYLKTLKRPQEWGLTRRLATQPARF